MTQARAGVAYAPAGSALRSWLDRLGRSRRIAAVASAAWTLLVAAYAIGFFGGARARGADFLDGAAFLVMLALPLILIWIAAFLAEELEAQRQLIAALAEVVGPLVERLDMTRASLDRHGPAAPAEIARAVQGAVMAARGGDASGQIERILEGQAQFAARLEALTASTATAPAAPPRARRAPVRAQTGAAAPAQPAPDTEATLAWDDLVRAFDFPRDADDEAGFAALRLALRQRDYAQVLQAAEDVMTLLSQEGLYMDDLAISPAAPDAWRRVAAGARGAAAEGVAALRDPAAVDATRALMKADPIFRDAALFFQRRFDAALGRLAPSVGDFELARLADTRSGRAFQLIARASGSFD